MDHTHEDSEFIQHEPCPKCGSRDNLARYDDGHAFCFGCNYREKAEGGEQKVVLQKGDKNRLHYTLGTQIQVGRTELNQKRQIIYKIKRSKIT